MKQCKIRKVGGGWIGLWNDKGKEMNILFISMGSEWEVGSKGQADKFVRIGDKRERIIQVMNMENTNAPAGQQEIYWRMKCNIEVLCAMVAVITKADKQGWTSDQLITGIEMSLVKQEEKNKKRRGPKKIQCPGCRTEFLIKDAIKKPKKKKK